MRKRISFFILAYLLFWVLVFLLFVFVLGIGEYHFLERITYFFKIADHTTFLLGFHSVFILLVGLFYIGSYFINIKQQAGNKTLVRRFFYRFILPVAILTLGIKTLVYANLSQNEEVQWDTSVMNTTGKLNNHFKNDRKHRGMSVFNWRKNNTKDIEALVRTNVEWVAVIPFLYQKNETTKQIDLPAYPEQFSGRDSTYIRIIRELHTHGIRVHLKPHLWMSSGWRSKISMKNKEEWNNWFASYRTNMLRYARMAQTTNTELLCIGTELRTSIQNQPEKWFQLITDIRSVYKGKLTYAANWHDEYEHVPFWKELDYIGIQAYFPLTKTKSPDLETIEKGWDRHVKAMELLHNKHHKPILFTEVGYKSESNATIKPWEWSSVVSVLTKKKSDRTQQLAYEALFNKTWNQPWFAGVYIWEWHNDTTPESAVTNVNFSPRFKPAENTIAKWFGK